jgi:hypothetical protein
MAIGSVRMHTNNIEREESTMNMGVAPGTAQSLNKLMLLPLGI